jgi:nitroimidazol reductase NimA-like FMN-containing flavoprotein (pyridoxamine 5'-phosphate oxidase superfamily)
MPVWGVWLDNDFYFSTSATSRKGRNLAANPNCAVTVSLDAIDVVAEGTVSIVDDESTLRRVVDVYVPKYDWPLTIRERGVYGENGDGGPMYRLSPVVAFGFEPGGTFKATRWRF